MFKNLELLTNNSHTRRRRLGRARPHAAPARPLTSLTQDTHTTRHKTTSALKFSPHKVYYSKLSKNVVFVNHIDFFGFL